MVMVMEDAYDIVKICFRVPPEDVQRLVEDLQSNALPANPPVHAPGATGGGDLVAIVVPIAAAAIAAAAKIIIEWARNRRVTIEIEGAKATGLSRESVEDILKSYIAAKGRGHSRSKPDDR